jgi:ADP-ribose pyrophosphatase
MVEYVSGFMFSEDMRNLVLIQKQHPEWMRDLWNGVGGKTEPGETTIEAMRREFLEETGVMQVEWDCFCELTFQGGNVYFFRTRSSKFNQVKTVTDEKVEVFPVNRLPRTVYNVRWLVPLAKDNFIDFCKVTQKLP